MTCAVARQSIQASLDGSLDQATQGELEAHLAGCAGCAEDSRSLKQAVEALEALPRMAAPADLMERLAPQLDRISRRQRSWRWAPAGAIAAGLLMALTLTRLQPTTSPTAPEQLAMEPPSSEEILDWVDADAGPEEILPF